MPTDIRPTTGQEALELLKAGNARYVDSLTSTDEYMQRRPELVKDQNPLAIILGCSDARVPVEIVFDQGLGDLFVIRVAGYNLHELATANGQDVDADELVDRSIRANVRMSVSQLKHGSRALEDLTNSGQLLVVGAEYDLETGKVRFLDS